MYDGGASFLLGEPIQGGDPNAKDLPRNNANPKRALMWDARNDENIIVSQLRELFLLSLPNSISLSAPME